MERTKRLKQRMLDARPEICVERARFLTESFRRTEGEPRVVRLAKAFDNVLRNMTVFIRDGELIVGNRTSKPRGSPLFPETMCSWLGPQLDILPRRFAQPFFVSETEKRELRRKILPYWKGKNAWERALELMPADLQREVYKNVFVMRAEFTNGVGHFIPGHGAVVREGLAAIRGRAEEKLRGLEGGEGREGQRDFLRAVLISLDAAGRFAGRFAGEADRLSREEPDPARKAELETIAEACRRVPMRPARTFHEGLQAVWFNQLLTQIEDGGFAISVGPLDRILYPLYRKDVDAGALTRGRAREMLECFYIKLSEVANCIDTVAVTSAGGPPIAQNLTIGGQDGAGNDATNELSRVCLDAAAGIRTVMPNLSVRVHPGTPDDFLLSACRAIRDGVMMELFNDEAIIPAMMRRGIPLEEARRYAIVGCVEPAVPEETFGSTDANLFNIAKCLELALRNGNGVNILKTPRVLGRVFKSAGNGGNGADGRKKNPLDKFLGTARRTAVRLAAARPLTHYLTEPKLKLAIWDHVGMLTGRGLGPRTGNPAEFASTDDVIEAYRRQVRHFVEKMVAAMDAAGQAHAELKPTPFISSTILGCIENARDVAAGGARYNFTGPQAIGVANVGDSLAALDRVVFREKSTTMREMLRILDGDFRDSEELRLRLLNHLPKYGNDDDGADRFARLAAEIYCEEVERHFNYRGGGFQPGLYSITGHITFGALTGATPDGRRAGEALAEGVAPARGRERAGPTAVLNSASKLNYDLTSNGVVLNMRFQPAIFRSEENVRKFAAMNRAYFARGGLHVQYNIVDADTLRKAKENPGDHRDLVVRVAGYSAHFTELDPATQDDIIRRTEHRVI